MKLRTGWILVVAALLVTLAPASALAMKHKSPKGADSTAAAVPEKAGKAARKGKATKVVEETAQTTTTTAGKVTRTTAKSAPAAGKAAAQTLGQTPPQAGMVWISLDSKVFHRQGSRWYGKTKNGKFMTEQEAIAAGARESKAGGKVNP